MRQLRWRKRAQADFQASGPAEAGDPLSAQASLSVPGLDGVVEEEPEPSCSAHESHSCASLDANACFDSCHSN